MEVTQPHRPRRHRSRRARFALTAFATVATLALSACSGSSGGEAAADSLDVWFPGSNPVEIELVTKTIVPAFEKENGVKVNATFLDYGDMSTKLNAAFAGGTAPDVFGHGPAAVADFVVNERVEPLTDYVAALPQAERDDMAAALPGGQVDGIQYLMPMSLQAVLLVYNKDDFTAAGLDAQNPPTTWEGIEKAAQTLTKRDASGKVTHSGLLLPSQPVGRQQAFTSLLNSNGGTLLSDDNSVAEFDGPEGLKALKFFVDTYRGDMPVSANLGANYIDSPAAQQPLATGDASITALSAQATSQLQANNPDLKLGVIQPPKFEDAPAGYAVGGAGAGLMINADSPNKDLGWKFIQYMTSNETATEYTQGIGAIPMRASAADSAYVKDSPIVQSWLEASAQLMPNPNVPGWVQIRDTIDKFLEQALNQTIEPQAALDQMADAVNKILAQNK